MAKTLETATAKDVMTETVVSVREDLSLEEVSALLTEHEISGAPVIDTAGSLLGVVSRADVVRTLGSTPEPAAGARALTVRKIMTPMADAVDETTSVPEIARLMTANHYHRVVVTRQEKTVGIVSAMDVLRLVAELG